MQKWVPTLMSRDPDFGEWWSLMSEVVKTNHLAGESSPYLLQHKNNPVDWYPWGEPAFQRAVVENKPIFLSVGYATCHWCHVMGKESFENEDVAQVLRESFISVKVDREERPEIDDLYMAVVQQLTGGGGWPMSVWLTPQGEPFFGGTYFTKDQFVTVNQKIAGVWQNSPEKVRSDATQLSDFLRLVNEGITPKRDGNFSKDILQNFMKTHFQNFDEKHGGFGGAPKFPQTMNLKVLVGEYYREPSEELKSMILGTIDGMCLRGMYDHLSGGFHRYSVDEFWQVPHFEKMLYDNALLISLLTKAYLLFGRQQDLETAKETADYILREMTSEQGGFYSAQDADSAISRSDDKKEEGFFCTYTYDSIKSILSEKEWEAMNQYFDLSSEGHFEGRNVISLKRSANWEDEKKPLVQSSFQKLLELRQSRPLPETDDKVVLAWNGMMISAMAELHQACGEEKYYKAARRAMEFIEKEMSCNGRLIRSWRNGQKGKYSYCDDYALFIKCLIDLYQSDFDEALIERAIELQKQQDELFWSEEHGLYFRDSGEDEYMITRTRDDYDGVTPSSNSQTSENLLVFFEVTGEVAYRKKAESLFVASSEQMLKHPMSRPKMLESMQRYWEGGQQVVLVCEGPAKAMDKINSLRLEFHPSRFIALTDGKSSVPVLKDKKRVEGEDVTVYTCENGVCKV